MMSQRGFSTSEFLTVTIVLAIALVFLLPQYVRAGIAEREDEVKANIHTIQIALERYAVDTGGLYPVFLIGAERNSNIIRSYLDLSGNGISQFPRDGMTPFAKVVPERNPIYRDLLNITMDLLIQFGYLAEYPVNPFAHPDSGYWQSYSTNLRVTGVYPYGGLHGDKMFDLGFGWGDTPQTDFILFTTEGMEERMARDDHSVFADPDLDAPGNFYYHPIFNDLIPVYFHAAANYSAIYYGDRFWSMRGIQNHDVDGYYLYGYGGPGDRDSLEKLHGDYFNRMPERNNLPDSTFVLTMNMPVLNSTVGAGAGMQARVETTGYPASQIDPWTGAYPHGINPNYPDIVDEYRKSGPDGVPDWVIIKVTSCVEINDELTDIGIVEGLF